MQQFCQVGSGSCFQAWCLAFREATQHRLQRTGASPLVGMRREPAVLSFRRRTLAHPAAVAKTNRWAVAFKNDG